jgi:Uma2 family endonuclease
VKLASNPDTVRAPDLSFVSRERIVVAKDPRGFWIGSPDLAVEILSPDDRPAVREKVQEYLTHGARLVWVVDPGDRSVTVYRPGRATVRLTSDDALDGDEILSGFRCQVEALFP